MSKKSTFPNTMVDHVKSNGLDHGFATVGPSLTRQEFAEECDINTIMTRYNAYVIGGPGNMPPLGPQHFVDWTAAPRTLMEYMDFMQEAEAAFMSLPAVVRKEFDNSPQEFIDFASDPENLPQMQTWGLAEKPKEAPVAPAPASAPGGASAAPSAPGAPGAAPTHGST